MPDEIVIDDNGGVGGSLRVTATESTLGNLAAPNASVNFQTQSPTIEVHLKENGAYKLVWSAEIAANSAASLIVRAGNLSAVSAELSSANVLTLTPSKAMSPMGPDHLAYYMPPKSEITAISIALNGYKVDFLGRMKLKIITGL